MDSPFTVVRRRVINRQRVEEESRPKPVEQKKKEYEKPAITESVYELLKRYRRK